MQFLREFWLGLYAYWEAFKFIKKHKMFWIIVIPAALMLGVYKLGYIIKGHVFESEVRNMNDIVWYLLQIFLEISIAILLMNFSKYLVVALLSPLLAYLSAKTEKTLNGNVYKLDLNQLWKDIVRSLKIVTRNFMWYYFFFTIILLISFVFWENPASSPIFYIIYFLGFYYYGFSFIDYVNERRKLNVRDSILFIRKHRALAISIGLVYSAMILVPVDINALFGWKYFLIEPFSVFSNFFVHLFLWFCASFAPILACVAATIAMNKVVELKN